MLVAERYRLGEQLGRGGMGEVFRAVDEVLGRPVAVKLLRPSDRDPAAAERFRREARSAAILNDTHVVAVYDFGQHGDRSYLVMELVEGGSVAEELVRTGPLPRDRAIDIIEQTAAGLAAAHRQDIVHRDIKPGNLLLATDGTVKIADFGIAHLADEGAATLTATGQIIGSTHYLAPERAQGRQAGKASDIYALGCVLYQLVVGHPPFTAEHPTAILYQHVDADPLPPSQLQPELGGAFEALLLRMLAKDPAARPTAGEIAAGALRAPIPADSAPAGAAAPGASPEGSSATLTDLAVPPPAGEPADGESGVAEGVSGAGALAGRRKYLLAGAAALVATAAAVAAGVLIDGNETQPPATSNLDPKPSVAPSTPGQTPRPTETRPSTNRTQPGAGNQSTPVRSPSQQGTPTPGSSPSSTPTSSPSTPSPSRPTESSDTPSAPPTSTTPPPEPSPSPSPSSKPSTSGTPSGAPPTPAANGVDPQPGSD